MPKDPRAPQILNASSNLIGFCFLVITSLKFVDKHNATYIDEIATITLLFFTASALFSFMSIRGTTRRSSYYESIAEYVFLAGLFLLLLGTILLALNLIH